ncbi:hypothetical protein PAPYR_2581 [Paratrimastix pyriformis]|uniref:EGF-like domain-containing protein n=1 Tax=Paratrimastix pyriformis TaxID=342808 RepID=A0ABQ8UPM4_9EUKA|nr:hypothetical protein PAPYR_2581 [Paratrimastix pyriformis]
MGGVGGGCASAPQGHSHNSHSGSQPGDQVTLRLTATEPLRATAGSPMEVVIAGHPISLTSIPGDAAGGTAFEAAYRLTGADSPGPVGFTVLPTLADLAGNTLEAPLSAPTEGPAVIFFGSNCTLAADCGPNGACVAVAAGTFGCHCPPGARALAARRARPSKACACGSAWTGDHCDTPVADVYRCLTDAECQAAGDLSARCAADGLTTTVEGRRHGPASGDDMKDIAMNPLGSSIDPPTPDPSAAPEGGKEVAADPVAAIAHPPVVVLPQGDALQ